MKGPFYKKVIKTQEGKWEACSVMTPTFDEDGSRGQDQIINIFMGHQQGRPEAERMCSMLNRAWEKFHESDAEEENTEENRESNTS